MSFGKLTILRSVYILPGMVILVRNGEAVWLGNLDDPWEDVECDRIEIAEVDYDRLLVRLSNAGH